MSYCLQRLQEAEGRNQELTSTISQGGWHNRYNNAHLYCSQNNCLLLYSLDVVFILAATKPLLRQIENLQAAHSTQSANWEKVEASLTQRLGK